MSVRKVGEAYVAENAIVTGDVVMKAGVNLWYGCVLRGDVARLTLEERVNLQDGTIVHADTDAPQTIEAGVVAGHLVMLHGVRVGRDTLVGIGARLLGGTIIGEECVIAAGAIVTEGKAIPPRSLVMGIPGRVVRQVTDEEVARTRLINAKYLELAMAYVAGQFPPPWQKRG